MIPAPRGLVALYRCEDGRSTQERTVIAFDDEGYPLVIGGLDGRRSLVRAASFDGYDGTEESLYAPVVALLPAEGWRVEWIKDGDSEWSQPLVGWGLRANGSVVPLVIDADCHVDEPRPLSEQWQFRINHNPGQK
jgi:hypothetical protein